MTALRYIADDYGLCPSVDRAIEALAAAGGLTGVSVLATHVAAQDAARLARIASIEIGLHLNLTEGAPLSAPRAVPGLVNAGGQLLPLIAQLGRAATLQLRRAELATEISAQWDRLHELAGRVDFVDGHEHAHMMPFVFAALKQTLAQPAQRSVRVRSGVMIAKGRRLRNGLLRACALVNLRAAGALPFAIGGSVVDYAEFDGRTAAPEPVEVMLHVAHPESPAPELDATSYSYAARVAQYRRRLAELQASRP